MKSHVTLLLSVVRMYGRELHINTVRDERTIVKRHDNQRSWFLEVSLPTLDAALTKGLSLELLQPITGYRMQAGTQLPQFLNGFWGRVFSSDGSLLARPCPISMLAIRQTSLLFKKIKELCPDDAIESALSGFVETDLALSQVKVHDKLETFRYVAQLAFGRVIGEVFENEDLSFKHGPGAVAETLDSVAKYDFTVVPDRLIERFGMDVFKPFFWQHDAVSGEIPARVIAVPKTATKPRLISIEPSYNQFIQQGIHTVLKRALGRNRICGYISQEPNKKLARMGSLDGSLATIDLSEASDRVHYGVLKSMFGFNQPFLEILDVCRSRSVLLPDGSEHILNKFASMGSALTFPMETMYFTVLVLSSICEVDGDYSAKNINSHLRSQYIRIYGDDIIVPTKYVHTVIRTLEEVGLKVNSDKSFFSGNFRESCGADYWKGHDVRPLYARERMPKSQHDVKGIESLISLRNQFYSRYSDCEVTEFLDSVIIGLLPMIPYGDPEASADLVLTGDRKVERWNTDLQRGERKGYVVSHKKRPVVASCEAVLFKALSCVKGTENIVFPDDHVPDHLTHHARPTSSYLKRRWVPAH